MTTDELETLAEGLADIVHHYNLDSLECGIIRITKSRHGLPLPDEEKASAAPAPAAPAPAPSSQEAYEERLLASAGDL